LNLLAIWRKARKGHLAPLSGSKKPANALALRAFSWLRG
jgi:hypothetical protein